MNIREINKLEVPKLLECLSALAEHHNSVSTNFKGSYPLKPYEDTLASFSEGLEKGTSRIAVADSPEKIIGFCKIDITGDTGELTHLAVLQEYRGSGYGKLLMDWAMEQFRKSTVRHIEVRVVDGNEAIHLYEKYGFKMRSHILGIKCNQVRKEFI